jgi:hypothetical protein
VLGPDLSGTTTTTVRSTQPPAPCSAAAFTTRSLPLGSILSNVRADFVFINSGAPCIITQPTKYALVDSAGNVHDLTVDSFGTYFGDPDPLPSSVLGTGEAAAIWLNWSVCNNGTVPSTKIVAVRFGFADGSSTQVAMAPDDVCSPVNVSKIGKPTSQDLTP